MNRKKLKWPWFLGGALYGIFLRFIFGFFSASAESVMSVAFLVGTPLVVGAITIYGYRENYLKISQMVFFPWLTTALMLLGTAIALLEGSICIAIMSPLFFMLSSIGGLLMGLLLRQMDKNSKPLLSIAILPFLIFIFDGKHLAEDHDIKIVESVVVAATPKVIWDEIMTAKEIHAEELPLSISHLIGVPKPVEGVNRLQDGVEIRYSIWEKGVNFRAEVIEKEAPKYIKWSYLFDENSFPKGSMDDHVAVGGRYFDLKDTSFTLTPVDSEKTQLTITANYRVNSNINFYAIPASKALGVDFVRTILGLYKYRSENNAE